MAATRNAEKNTNSMQLTVCPPSGLSHATTMPTAQYIQQTSCESHPHCPPRLRRHRTRWRPAAVPSSLLSTSCGAYVSGSGSPHTVPVGLRRSANPSKLPKSQSVEADLPNTRSTTELCQACADQKMNTRITTAAFTYLLSAKQRTTEHWQLARCSTAKVEHNI